MGAQSGPSGKVYQPSNAEMARIMHDAKAAGIDPYTLLWLERQAASAREEQEAALADIRDNGT